MCLIKVNSRNGPHKGKRQKWASLRAMGFISEDFVNMYPVLAFDVSIRYKLMKNNPLAIRIKNIREMIFLTVQ